MADDKEWLPKGAADEKGWWEEDPEPPLLESKAISEEPPLLSARIVVEEEPEAETEVEETGVEVKAGPVSSALGLMVLLFMLYLFYWTETSDSIFAQLCCGPLFWLLFTS